jgi:hypothetical protein
MGLSPADLVGVREAVAHGRKPKVVFTASAGQVSGQLGQVVALTDPADSDEFVVVRFGRDELPFSPADVALAPRGAAPRKPPEPEPAPPARPEPEFVIDKPVPPSPVPAPEVPAPAAVAPAPRRGRPKPGPKPPVGLTVTLSYGDGEWSVAAEQGGKVLAKPYAVRPAEALRFVALVDVPGVREAVEQILAVERAQAEREAERLRAELAEIEARLAELRDAG